MKVINGIRQKIKQEAVAHGFVLQDKDIVLKFVAEWDDAAKMTRHYAVLGCQNQVFNAGFQLPLLILSPDVFFGIMCEMRDAEKENASKKIILPSDAGEQNGASARIATPLLHSPLEEDSGAPQGEQDQQGDR